MIYERINIKDFSGNFYTSEEFVDLIKKYDNDGYDFYIGSDSQYKDNYINFITAICPRKINSFGGTCGKIFYLKDVVSRERSFSLRQRMLAEAYRSIEVAMDLDPFIKGLISIHLDVGTTNNSKTSLYAQELQFLVKAQGYECKVKPDSWMASAAADRVSRT